MTALRFRVARRRSASRSRQSCWRWPPFPRCARAAANKDTEMHKLPITLLQLVLPFALALPAFAHEGHDDAPSAPVASSPQRLPDGSVSLPKPSQRQLAIRTIVAEQKTLPQAVELAGKVVIDPNAGGKVQAT